MYQRKARWWERYTKHMVGRETRMSWLPARSWYVAVHGLLQDTTTQEVIGNYLEERKVHVSRGQSTQVVFDFRRKAAPIEVQLYLEDSAAAPQARVAVLGMRDSLRFVKDASTTVFLPQGKHTLLIGVEDRVYERTVEVREMVGQTVGVQVDRVDTAVFSGCKDAVEPYLQGDLAAASRSLERSGKVEAAALIRATLHRMRGETEEGARWLEKAGRFQEAAELSKQASPEPKRSAELFEKAGDFHNAAEEHARGGDPLQAARAYEAAFEYGEAIEAYRNAGAPDKALDLLEKTGRFFEAGALALEQGESDRALRCFQQVGQREPEYADACDALAKLFSERRAFDLAAEKSRESVDARGGDEAPLEAQEGLAVLLERAGREEQALAVWENIRKRDFQYAGASERVDALRESMAAATQRASEAQAATIASGGSGTPRESRYEILGEIGRGGMGVVLTARDTRLGRVVALKRMPDNLKNNPTAVQLFLREARAAAALSHPNIVTLFDADQEADGSYYLTMELLEGFGLDSVLQKRGKLTARDAVRIGIQIAKGLQFAHEKGVVHRDIKTANLFFTRDRVLKIMDFGLAKMSEEVRKAATVIGGTPYYMAPEQAVGGDVDHRADLYALGVTLFELVTGSVPFKDGDITHHHRHTMAPDPRSLEPDVPEPLAKLILKLMEKSPDMRPTTTAEVVRALEQILAQLGGSPSAPGGPS
jgi:tetratricopeptide (TPR) repeat protein